MSFGVEDELVEWYEWCRVVREQQVEILERLAKPEALHLVAVLRTAW